eukprot:jgi/Tetstr1/449435/TSEL_036530.t1
MRPRGSEQVSTAKGPRAASSARKTSPSRRQSWLAVDCAPKPGEAVGEGVLPAWDVTGDERDDVALQEFEKSREQLEGVRGVTPPEESARAAGSTLHGSAGSQPSIGLVEVALTRQSRARWRPTKCACPGRTTGQVH